MSSKKNRGKRAYNKGLQLEQDFAQWMQRKMGYNRTKFREFVNGKIATRPYEIDIHGIKEQAFWRLITLLGIALVVLSILMIIGELDVVRYYVQDVVSLIRLKTKAALFIIGGIGLAIGYWGRSKHTQHAWVECKNLSTKVKRDHIFKLKSSVKDVRQSKDTRWQPDLVIFVSGSGYDIDALNFARANGIVCYQVKGKGFEKV